MRSFLAASAVLLLLFGLAAWNCRFVGSTGEQLLAAEEALPEIGNEAEEAIHALRKLWNAKVPLLELSVRRDLLQGAETALGNLETLRKSEENADYLAAKAAFRLAITTMLRLEHPSWESIF